MCTGWGDIVYLKRKKPCSAPLLMVKGVIDEIVWGNIFFLDYFENLAGLV